MLYPLPSSYKVTKNLAKLSFYSSIFWKVEHVNDQMEYLTKEIIKQSRLALLIVTSEK
jgi:hypothetical protein